MSSNKTGAEPTLQQFEFEAMNLQVGGRIQFITHRTIKPVQHFSTLIAYVKDEYMIVKIPLENGVPIVLNEGDKLTIRVFSGVTVCSFACSVLRIFQRPLNYVPLSFPKVIQGTSLRTAMRVKVDIPAQLTYRDLQALPVFLINLSVSGALIESPTVLEPDESGVSLAFTMLAHPNGQQIRIHTRATVQNVSVVKTASPSQQEVFTYGVQFIDLEPTHYTMLQNLTYEALIADRQKIV